MKINGYRQDVLGRWYPFYEEVGFVDYLRHLTYSIRVVWWWLKEITHSLYER